MEVPHARPGVWRSARVLGQSIGLIGALMAIAMLVGTASASSNGGFQFLLWGKSGGSFLVTVWGAPVGEFLIGVLLVVFGQIVSKTAPFIVRRREGIPMMSWHAGRDIREPVKRLKAQRAYPQRRIGRRMLVFGVLSAAAAALMVPLFLSVRDTIEGDGGTLQTGAWAALGGGLAAFVLAIAMLVVGAVFWLSASPELATPTPPPMPGMGPTLPAPPGAPA